MTTEPFNLAKRRAAAISTLLASQKLELETIIARHDISRDERGFLTGDHCPTRFLCILNVGHTGAKARPSAAHIQAVLISKSGFVSFFMSAGKPFGFVEFKDSETAKDALESVDGISIHDEPPLLLEFVHFIPNLFLNEESISTMEPPTIPGLIIYHDFINAETEKEILNFLYERPWIDLSHRRVQHYGLTFEYDTHGYSKAKEEIPPWGIEMIQRYNTMSGLSLQLDQLTINEYQPGMGIGPHVDLHHLFGEHILIVSLNSTCVMEFQHILTGRWKKMVLMPRSLVILTEEARYGWKHSIRSRKSDVLDGCVVERQLRVSITFRSILKDGKCPCNRRFPCI